MRSVPNGLVRRCAGQSLVRGVRGRRLRARVNRLYARCVHRVWGRVFQPTGGVHRVPGLLSREVHFCCRCDPVYRLPSGLLRNHRHVNRLCSVRSRLL